VTSTGVGPKGGHVVGPIEHIGITVPDLPQAIQFFETVLGWKQIRAAGPFADPDGDWMQSSFAIHRSSSLNLALFETGTGMRLEIFEWAAPDQRTEHPRISDIGGPHIGIAVSDLLEAIERVAAADGVTMLAGPNTASISHGEETFIYFLTPWGLPMELVQRGEININDGEASDE
jgi:catechol 2,3-dioxygenase-like lactoylglutathione lyase family enzyme